MSLNDLIKLGTSIKKLRKEKGWTQRQMADELGISYSTYSNYENNYRMPDVDTLLHISEILKVDVAQLFNIDNRVAGISNLDYDNKGNISIESLIPEEIEKEILIYLSELNDKGLEKAIEQIKMLTKIPEYRKDDE